MRESGFNAGPIFVTTSFCGNWGNWDEHFMKTPVESKFGIAIWRLFFADGLGSPT